MISCKDKEIIKIFLTDWHKLTRIKNICEKYRRENKKCQTTMDLSDIYLIIYELFIRL